MVLIKSISGIRGTLENIPGQSLSDYDIKQFTLAYIQEIIRKQPSNVILVGRDARESGERISNIIKEVVSNEGLDVIDLGLVTTPTIGIGVKKLNAAGGIMISASHNDERWNALKLLNSDGEFLHPKDVQLVIKEETREASQGQNVGNISSYEKALDDHINIVLSQDFIDIDSIKAKSFSVAVDGINSVGGIAVPRFLERIGINKIHKINCEPDGKFNHNPEPLPENITHICSEIKKGNFDFGVVVDPDADRLCLVDENGIPFGEEYTLVACADYVLGKNPGATVSNLSSTRALADVANLHGQTYTASAVGEVHVVAEMKKSKAVIGGEGNGGIIYPGSHYGRDALVGVVLFLSLLAERKVSVSQLRATYPNYYMSKNKINLKEGMDVDRILRDLANHYSNEIITSIDGLKIDFEHSWVHLRKSNTEPIIRIYTEAKTQEEANAIAYRFDKEIKALF